MKTDKKHEIGAYEIAAFGDHHPGHNSRRRARVREEADTARTSARFAYPKGVHERQSRAARANHIRRLVQDFRIASQGRQGGESLRSTTLPEL